MTSFYINKSESKDNLYHGNEIQVLFGENWEAARERSFWRDLKATAEQEKQIQEHPRDKNSWGLCCGSTTQSPFGSHTAPLPPVTCQSVPAPSGQKLPHFVLDFLKITPLTKTKSHSSTVLGLDPKLTNPSPSCLPLPTATREAAAFPLGQPEGRPWCLMITNRQNEMSP